MSERSRLPDLFVPLGLALGGAALVPPDWSIWGVIVGGGAGAALRWFGPRANPRTPADDARPALLPLNDDAVLAALPVPLLLIDAGASVTAATPATERLLARRTVGQPISAVFRAPAILAAVDQALTKGIGDSFDFRINRPRPMTLTATLAVLPPGAPGRIALLLQDDTSRVRVRDARSDFVANASHELRTPLAAISGLVETLQGPAKNDPAARERFLGLIAKQSARMTRLVDDLLSLSRIESEENILPKTEQDVRAILGDALAAIAPVTDTVIERDIPPSLPKVRGSRDELLQVFVNLIENAVKYAGDAGPIRVSAHSGGQTLNVIISDSGPGIAPEDIPRLTERFYRVDPADSRTRGGTGLGLAIVKHIVNRHRGTLHIESELGGGAVFRVELPVTSSDAIG